MVEQKPQMVIQDMSNVAGYHNMNPNTPKRLEKACTYKDLSTVCIIPTRGMIAAKTAQSWMSMMIPMNQKFIRIMMIGMKVDEAYNTAIEQVLANPELSKWKYIMTMEDDNMPPADGLLKLQAAINEKPYYDVVQGIYWTKGENGQPMIYGDPDQFPLNFIPQMPKPETLQRCNGLGMGFNLFKMDIFRDSKIPKPWFKTQQELIPGQGVRCYTQDLYFYENASKAGYKFACDTRCKVGHYDFDNDIVW